VKAMEDGGSRSSGAHSARASVPAANARPAPEPTLGVVVDDAAPKRVRLVPYASTHGKGLVAWAGFTDTMHVDGWSYLS
jgi:hypothetical protein